MATATSQGRDPLFVSSKSIRAAEIKIRFADIIVKSSSNKPEAMMKMRREKQRKLLQEEKARMRMRQEARLAVLKVEEEEARSDYLRDDKLFLIDHHVTSAQVHIIFCQIGFVLTPFLDQKVLLGMVRPQRGLHEKNCLYTPSLVFFDPFLHS
ncbi:uncharacterized protein LOC130498551 isoform X1 [Raphanus sativus]|uniref:Uncharacterized protein LOC130498551 isoform X1 n=1 Tax=Raphanus sativus TaxID=3726 RepID=A0A9W3C946_RAPSA|nr:uncharacterized protein LOC130498551 isoform X1 [Raphanus sativus]